MNDDLTQLRKTGIDKKSTILQKWTTAQEELLAEWSEKATCFRWLHSRSEKSYRTKNYSYTIPVIILSTLTGTANFAMDSFVPSDYKQIAMACVGGVNIFAGILSTLQNFLRYAELMESHRSCEVQWSKFGRNIAVELALDPLRRKPADDFLKICRAEYDRLIEQSPPIDDSILNQFKRTFKGNDIRKPDICNGLDRCKIFKPSLEEKSAETVACAAQKLLKIGPNKSWTTSSKWPGPDTGIMRTKGETGKGETAKDELDGLMNMGKVSSFRKKIDPIAGDPITDSVTDSPTDTLKIIHGILKTNAKKDVVIDFDIEKGDIEHIPPLPEKSVEVETKSKVDIEEASGSEKLQSEFLADLNDF